VRTQHTHLPLLFHINVLRGAKFMGVKHTLWLQDLYAPLRHRAYFSALILARRLNLLPAYKQSVYDEYRRGGELWDAASAPAANV
jgi:hypothetical protein